jgi:gamma-glutamyl-gamma-aminobutyrate hydrolase PuuD
MKLGITQRVEYLTKYNETRDCLDQRWSKLFEKLKINIIPIPNTLRNVEEWQNTIKCDGYVLTGGNDISNLPNAKNTAKERDKTEIALLKNAQSNSLPVFSACRGFQLMNVFLGGELERISGHVAKRHSVHIDFDQNNKSKLKEVNSYHEWGISKDALAKDLIPCAYDNNGYIEAARHKKLNWFGVMWHPEREKKFKAHDISILKNLFNIEF